MALKQTFIFGAVLASVLSAGMAFGQNNTPGTHFERLPADSASLPLASPGVFDYDAQVFAPLEFTNGKEKAPNTGFYFSLDKTYTSIGRGAKFQNTTQEFVSTGSEWFWGTKYELGWIGEEEAGWNIVFNNTDGTFFTNGQDANVGNPMLVNTKFTTGELNRMFRQNLSAGGYFEPYLGLRHNSISDNSLQDTVRFDLRDVDPNPIDDEVDFQTFTTNNRFKQKATNSAFGLQAGARYNQRRGRWRMTCDGTVATTYNQQRYFASDIASTTDPDGLLTQTVTETTFSDQSFVPILDGSLELAYNISRDLSLKLGVQGNYMWNGIARVNTETTNANGNSQFGVGTAVQPFDENYIAAGVIFGVEWRR